MNPTRRARLSSQILQEVSLIVSRSLKDPRIGSISVTKVDLTEDAGQANVWVLPLGALAKDPQESSSDRLTEDEQALMDGLKSSESYVRSILVKRLDIRVIPKIVFKLDRGVMHSLKIHEILKNLNVTDSDPKNS